MNRFLTLLLLLCLSGTAFSQKKFITAKTANGKLKTIYDRGLRMASLEQYEDAIQDFEKALQLEPNFIDAQVQWANVKNQQLKMAEAEAGYEKALALDSTYLADVYYSLAIVEFDLHKYEEAATHFEQYLKTPKINPNRKAKSEFYLANVKFAMEAIKNPVPYEPKNLGPNINTPESEYLPTLTADGEALIYTAVRNDQEDFYRSVKVNGEWQPSEPIHAVNTPINEGAQSISADGKMLIFTACLRRDGMGSCDLYFSELKNGKWTSVQNIGAPINSPALETQPSLSADGQLLYFMSTRSGGLGGKDLWMSQRLPNGKWGAPKNVGAPVNTAGDEQSPFMHADGQTLYFMSNGHPGMGGFDLYLTRKQEDGNWGVPQNLGYPINSEGNEGALSVSLDGKTAYFATDLFSVKKGTSSFDNPQGKGTTDIYSFEMPATARPRTVTYVKATVLDAITRMPITAKVEFVELTSGKIFAKATTEVDGEFIVTLPVGGNYALNVSKEKYLFHSENFALDLAGTVDQPYNLEIALTPFTVGAAGAETKPIVLKNVFFETGSDSLRKESRIELELLKKLMDENPALKIQINGHTDNVGLESDNLALSEARAKAVYDYLTQHGIVASRLKYKGFGETKPAASNDTEEGRQKNRRTEYTILR